MGDRKSMELKTAYDKALKGSNHSSVSNRVAFHSRPGLSRRVNWAVGSAFESSDMIRMRVRKHDGFRGSEAAKPIRTTINKYPFLDQQTSMPAVDSAFDFDLAARTWKPKLHASPIGSSPANVLRS
jgi:hypothetical protein